MAAVLSPSFKTPPLTPQLSRDELHIWLASLDQPVRDLPRHTRALSTEERRRADSYSFALDSRRFISRRWILRGILGCYLGADPSELALRYGKNGKPELCDVLARSSLNFSLSHSDGVGLFAFAQNRVVGVDIERVREVLEIDSIAEDFFSTREKQLIGSVCQRDKKDAFFTIWTCREAFVKALGDGLSQAPLGQRALSRVAGSLDSSGSSEQTHEESKWSVECFRVAPRFAAAFCLEGPSTRVLFWRWTDEWFQSRIARPRGRMVEQVATTVGTKGPAG